MKLDKTALLEIVDIVRNGLVTGSDISESLRELDLDLAPENTLSLSESYLAAKGRDK